MGKQKQQKTINGFTESQIKNWENSDGVNFAIALSQITGWLLQVDWWASHEDDIVENMIPLRVYVATNTDSVFDFMGKMCRTHGFLNKHQQCHLSSLTNGDSELQNFHPS